MFCFALLKLRILNVAPEVAAASAAARRLLSARRNRDAGAALSLPEIGRPCCVPSRASPTDRSVRLAQLKAALTHSTLGIDRLAEGLAA